MIKPYTSRISECAFISYFFFLSFFPFSADAIKYLCLFTAMGCWVANMVSEKRVLFVKTSLNVPILSFLVCSSISSLHSEYARYSIHTVFQDYFLYFALFFCMVNTLREEEQIRRMVRIMLIICGAVCAYGLYGYYTGIAIHAGRLIATFEYHSRIAKYISMLLPVAICLCFYYKDVLSRFWLVILIGICGFSLILTMNRTSWVAIFITLLFIGFINKKKLFVFTFLGICAILVCILPLQFLEHAKSIVQFRQYLTTEKILCERILCWKASIAMIREHPVLGIGPGSRAFRYAYQRYGQEIRNREELQARGDVPAQPEKEKNIKEYPVRQVDRLSHAHNIFLYITVGSGIVGLLSFLWLFTIVFYKAVKAWKSSPMNYTKMLLMGIVASLISIFLHGFTDSFWKKPDALFLWYIIGILFIILKGNEETRHRT